MQDITILTIGDELLIGQVIDTNAAFMARELNTQGMEVKQKWTIADTLPAIQGALKDALTTSEVVLMTGGLGPTRDDVTKKALSAFFEVDMVFSENTWQRIESLFERWGRTTTPAHREQCFMPENAQLLTNKMGTAPGMWMEYEGKIVVSMPGVPYEMKYLMANEVLPRLKEKFKIKPILHRTIKTIGEGESRLAQRIVSIEDNLPDFVKLAYLPSLGQVRLRLTARHDDEQIAQQALKKYGDKIKALVPEFIFGENELTAQQAIGELLLERQFMLGVAESCTGGLLGHQIVLTPGASAYFKGGVMAYSYELKKDLLGVSATTLETFGAVSEETVIEMVQGTIAHLGVDVAVSISGIAGPGGATEDKPVGTIWMAAGTKDKIETLLIHAGKDREKNMEYAASRALGLLWQFLRA